jgi:hypothetical protein
MGTAIASLGLYHVADWTVYLLPLFSVLGDTLLFTDYT